MNVYFIMFYTTWNYFEPIFGLRFLSPLSIHLYSFQGEADRPCAICSDRTVFDRCPKPTASPIFCPQNSIKLLSTPWKVPKLHFWGCGSVLESFISKGRSCDTSCVRFLYPHYFCENSFQLLVSAMCPGYPKMWKYWDLRQLYYIQTVHRRIIKCFPMCYSQHTLQKYYGVWALSSPFCNFLNR